MANLPAKHKQEPQVQTPQGLIRAITSGAASGLSLNQLANELAKGDKKARSMWRSRIIKAMTTDPSVSRAIQDRCRVQLQMALPQITEGLVERAVNTGRADVVKLAFEASGFHNPRVQHDHAGEVTIKVEIPRPASLEEGVVDAEVVEEG